MMTNFETGKFYKVSLDDRIFKCIESFGTWGIFLYVSFYSNEAEYGVIKMDSNYYMGEIKEVPYNECEYLFDNISYDGIVDCYE